MENVHGNCFDFVVTILVSEIITYKLVDIAFNGTPHCKL